LAEPVEVSVVVPVKDEAGNVVPLAREIAAALQGERYEAVFVDDGSSDATAEVARGHGVVVISHPHNRGIAAARNTGLNAASADIVAYLDDDCEPEPDWAAQLLSGYDDENVAGVCGEIVPNTPPGYLRGYLARNNPLQPLDLELAESHGLPYRFRLYLRRLWATQPRPGRRDIYASGCANMSFRRKALFDAGQFDERFSFGGEDLDTGAPGTTPPRRHEEDETLEQYYERANRELESQRQQRSTGHASVPPLPPTTGAAAAWPKLDDAAYHGVVGEVVRTMEPHTEADPVAILLQLLFNGGRRATEYQRSQQRRQSRNVSLAHRGNTISV